MRWILAFFGVLNLVFGVLGLLQFGYQLSWHWSRWHFPFYAWIVFLLMSTISLFLVVTLGYLGILLLQGKRSAVVKTAWVCVAEVAYVVVDVVLFWRIYPDPHISIGFWGNAQAPLTPQLIAAYPVITLVAMLLIYRRLRNAGELSVG